MAYVLAVLVALLLTGAPAARDGVYDFEWRSFSRLSRLSRGEVVATAGELSGRGTLSLTAPTGDELAFTWSGPEGTGRGKIRQGAVVDIAFPTPAFPDGVPAGVPAAPPHLVGASYEPVGGDSPPRAFTIRYVDGFLCRADPAVCDDVNSWERHFEGRAVRRAP